MNEWQPVETAPKDTLVLVFCRGTKESFFEVAELTTVGKKSIWFNQESIEIETRVMRVTHWAHLEAPK